MATDTAFAVALIVMMGSRVPVALRIFLTAAAIVDDIGAITVVAIFYSHQLHLGALAAAAAIVVGLALLRRADVYTVVPYVLMGALLWLSLLVGGVHATMAGVLLAMFIPTRPPPNLDALQAQASAVLAAEIRRVSGAARDGTASRNELQGSTITITSLGKLGGIVSTPIINAPEVAIVGINKAIERPVIVNGEVAVRLMMNISSSFDHRFIDGYDAAETIQALKEKLEQPATIFIRD